MWYSELSDTDDDELAAVTATALQNRLNSMVGLDIMVHKAVV